MSGVYIADGFLALQRAIRASACASDRLKKAFRVTWRSQTATPQENKKQTKTAGEPLTAAEDVAAPQQQAMDLALANLKKQFADRPLSHGFVELMGEWQLRSSIVSVWGEREEDLQEAIELWNKRLDFATELISAAQASIKVLVDADRAHENEMRKAQQREESEREKKLQREERERHKLAVEEAKKQMKLAAAGRVPKAGSGAAAASAHICDMISDGDKIVSPMTLAEYQTLYNNDQGWASRLVKPFVICAECPWAAKEWSTARLTLSAFRHGFPRSPQGKPGGAGTAAMALPHAAGVSDWMSVTAGLNIDECVLMSDHMKGCPHRNSEKDSQVNMIAWSGSYAYIGTEVLAGAGSLKYQLEGQRSIVMISIAHLAGALRQGSGDVCTICKYAAQLEQPSREFLDHLKGNGVEIWRVAVGPNMLLWTPPGMFVAEKAMKGVAGYGLRLPVLHRQVSAWKALFASVALPEPEKWCLMRMLRFIKESSGIKIPPPLFRPASEIAMDKPACYVNYC